jgi:hypothetical protein
MVPYDARQATSAPLQRPVMTPHFFTNGSYSPVSGPYSPSPMTTMAGLPYPQQPQQQQQHHNVAYGGYGSYNSSPTAVESPVYKHDYAERTIPRVMSSEPDRNRVMSHAGHIKDYRPRRVESSRSPSTRSESQRSTSPRSVSSNPSAISRTITANEPINGAKPVEFDTEIDLLMKVIQAKKETDDLVKKAEAELIDQDDVEIKSEMVGCREVRDVRRRSNLDVAEAGTRSQTDAYRWQTEYQEMALQCSKLPQKLLPKDAPSDSYSCSYRGKALCELLLANVLLIFRGQH